MTILALDLGTKTGWATRDAFGLVTSGVEDFRGNRFDGGGIRFVLFRNWLTETKNRCEGKTLEAVYYEEVRRHNGTDAAHVYGGFWATLTAWCEHHGIPYMGIPVGQIKKQITGKGNAGKQQVIAAVRQLGHRPKDDNEADAIAILRVAQSMHGEVVHAS